MGFVNHIPRLLRWVFSVMLFFLVTLTVYRFIFFFHYRGEHRPFSGSAFLLGLRFDARYVSILGMGMLLLCSLPFLNPVKNIKATRFWNILLTMLFLVTLIFLGSDFYHYDYLKQRLNASVLNFLQDAGISFSMMFQSYPLVKIILLLAVLLAIFAYWHNGRLKYITGKEAMLKNRKLITGYYLVFVLLTGAAVFGKIGQFPLRWSDAFRFADDFKANTALNPFQSFFSTLSFQHSGYDKKKLNAYYPLMASYLEVKDPDASNLKFERFYSPADTFVNKPNVVLVICESFSAYKTSVYGNPLHTTPYFDKMCSEGVFFDRCFTPAFGTARGVWATITGIPDVESPKTASRNPNVVDQHTIINDFKGYERFYFLGGNPTWANIQGLLSNNISGLRIYAQDDFRAKKVDVWGISDKNLFLEANGILRSEKKPFFAIIQTADNHRPFTIPEEDRKQFKFVEYPLDVLKKNGFESNEELNAFRYTDFCYQQFMETVKKESYYSNTIFVFIGDHGIRGDAGELFPKAWTKQGLTCEHVPLLFYWPGKLGAQRVHSVSSQVDILPSVATLARVPYRNNTFGRNLFDSVYQQRDSAQRSEKFAFIIDHDLHTVGLVSEKYYYLKNVNTGKAEMVSMLDDANVPVTPETDSAKRYLGALTEAWHEAAKYLLYNNKKKN